VIQYNQGKQPTEFSSPILGYKLALPDKTKINTNIYDIPYDALFKFNKGFGIYNALVFKRNHGLTNGDFDGDFSLVEIYNTHWWWYIKAD
jgi:hypothetical protein